MTIDKDVAMTAWEAAFGDVEMATDCYGVWMKRSDYGDHETKRKAAGGKSYYYGWDLDHIRPRSDFENETDADFYNNLEPVHFINNSEKADKYPAYVVRGQEYTVVKCEICASNGVPGYGIKLKSSGGRVDWKARKGICFKNGK